MTPPQLRQRQRILVVDDDHDNALVIKMILECDGFEVDMFTDPKEALARFEPQKYTLAIIDLRMKGIDGFELYERFLEMDHRMKLCFISGYDYRDALAKFQGKHSEILADCFLKKPLSIEGFMVMVKRLTRDTSAPSLPLEMQEQEN